MCVAFLGSLVTQYKQPSCSSSMKAILHSLADSKDKSKQSRFLPKGRKKKKKNHVLCLRFVCDNGLSAVLSVPGLGQASPISIINSPHFAYVNTASNFLLIGCFIYFLSQE